MSRHFNTPSALQDPRINVCDFYLFRGRPGSTVMALTVNPDAALSAPDTFRDEGLYAFPFESDSPGAFDALSANGRALTDDVMDVILTLASNTSLGDGVAPDPGRTRTDFPYLGAPYSPAEQAGLTPATKSGKRS